MRICIQTELDLKYWVADTRDPLVSETKTEHSGAARQTRPRLADGGFSGDFIGTTRILMTFRTDWAT